MNASAPRTTAGPAVGQATRTSTRRRLRGSHVVIAATAVAVARMAADPQRASRRDRVRVHGLASGPTSCRPGSAGFGSTSSERPAARRDRGRTRCRRRRRSPPSASRPGETLRVRVGGWGGEAVGPTPGAGGWNGGGDGGGVRLSGRAPGKAGSGGGGATDVRRGGDGLEHRIIVAAGGSGGAGGAIGGPIGTGGGNGGGASGARRLCPPRDGEPGDRRRRCEPGRPVAHRAGTLAAISRSRRRPARSESAATAPRATRAAAAAAEAGSTAVAGAGPAAPSAAATAAAARDSVPRDDVPSRRRRRRRARNDLLRPRPRRV